MVKARRNTSCASKAKTASTATEPSGAQNSSTVASASPDAPSAKPGPIAAEARASEPIRDHAHDDVGRRRRTQPGEHQRTRERGRDRENLREEEQQETGRSWNRAPCRNRPKPVEQAHRQGSGDEDGGMAAPRGRRPVNMGRAGPPLQGRTRSGRLARCPVPEQLRRDHGRNATRAEQEEHHFRGRRPRDTGVPRRPNAENPAATMASRSTPPSANAETPAVACNRPRRPSASPTCPSGAFCMVEVSVPCPEQPSRRNRSGRCRRRTAGSSPWARRR